MTIEISVESYVFTCVRCGERWAEDYRVSQVTDDAGLLRSFYRHHGSPCEAPVSGNLDCPNCHDTRAVRDPLYGGAPDLGHVAPAGRPTTVPAQRGVEISPAPARRPATATWRRFKFSAVLALRSAGPSRRQYLSGVPGLMVRAPSCQFPARQQYFPAFIYTDDNRPLRPGDKGVRVVISVPDYDASGFFQPGQHFTLWDGADIGHGTVAQHLVFQGP